MITIEIGNRTDTGMELESAGVIFDFKSAAPLFQAQLIGKQLMKVMMTYTHREGMELDSNRVAAILTLCACSITLFVVVTTVIQLVHGHNYS